MRSLEFSYSFYKGVYLPIVPIKLQHQGEWYDVWTYVDSGATYSLFTNREALSMGLDLRGTTQRYVIVGDGGYIPASFIKIPVRIGDVEIDVEIGFSENLGIGFNLLGRKDVFEKFRVCFDDTKKIVSFHENNGM